MSSSASSHIQQLAKNLLLVAISILYLPLTSAILLASYLLRPLLFLYGCVAYLGQHRGHAESQASKDAQRPRQTVLITGVGMTKGLTLARTFYLAGHRVIGADIATFKLIPPSGRFSSAVYTFHTLPSPSQQDGPAYYIHELLKIVHREKVDIWISCSGVASALEDAQAKEVIERRSDCLCVQFDLTTTSILHAKDTFIEHTASLGLPVPETHNVTSRGAVHNILHQSPRTKKKYIMKSVGVDDASRDDNLTLLPRRTLSETYNHVARVSISAEKPWVLQQYVTGKREYCTHALVIRGQVKAFVACPSSELLMHYEALPHPESALSRAMLRFTQEFVSRSSRAENDIVASGTRLEPMTGHLSFDFLVEEVVTEKGTECILRAIECNPRAHTAVVLFRGKEVELANAYLSLLDNRAQSYKSATETPRPLTQEMNGHADRPTSNSSSLSFEREDPREYEEETSIVTPPPQPFNFYWLGHDLIALVVLPLLHLIFLPFANPNPITLFLQTYPSALTSFVHSTHTFLHHLFFWHDGTFEIWDPLPAWVLYHVYWPGVFLGRAWQGREGWWSRCNVGTCKVFGL